MAGYLDLLFPQNIYCNCCGDIMDSSRIHGICDKCASKIQWISDNPYEHEMYRFAFDDLISCCIYGFYPRRIMNRLKSGKGAYAAEGIALLMAERARDFGRFDAVIPVPMHKDKLKKRGYNQAQLLAETVCAELKLPLMNDALLKVKPTASMRGSDAETRRNALKDVFSVNKAAFASSDIPKTVLLIDDVVTTGSTADACASVLKDAGCEWVSVLCFACGAGFTSV